MAARNLVNLNAVEKGYGSRSVLSEITLGVNDGDRVGLVGRNGAGKTTLLRLVAGIEKPDNGTVVRARDVSLAMLAQSDDLDDDASIGGALIGERARHEWAGDAGFRSVLDGLLGGVDFSRFAAGLETRSRLCRAVNADVSHLPGLCWRAHGCCCSMSRRTISTWLRSTGWPDISPSGREPCW